MYNLTIEEATFLVVDLETTGLSPSNSEIIEIAALKVEGGVIVDRFHTLVKPTLGFIPPYITKLTGITNALVVDKPTIEDIFPQFLEFSKNSIIVAHNAQFDLSFLNAVSYQITGKLMQNPVLCTQTLAKRLFPDVPSKSLVNLAYHFNIPYRKKHRALSDAEVTFELFKKMIDYLYRFNINKVIDLVRLSNGKDLNQTSKRRRYV
ncbi:3'-5' exonuclease [Sulfurihydrogenibium sp.]|uniref:3'-5' exonuclease n=1 Tax=Sulfurihydrogenibium sp. TaxID=2053621 RepID=UPI002608F8DD|nr:3'-5' exonuclease [Sulfurihydrogenibium sp.]